MQIINPSRPPILEITVISAQDLMRRASFVFSGRLRPYTTLSARPNKMYRTRVDESGGVNPTWGDRFEICLDQGFFYQRCSGIYLQIYTKRLLLGRSRLGWCLVPASDLLNRLAPVGATQFLSYRLRDRDGSRGHGVVNVAVRLHGGVFPSRPLLVPDNRSRSMEPFGVVKEMATMLSCMWQMKFFCP